VLSSGSLCLGDCTEGAGKRVVREIMIYVVSLGSYLTIERAIWVADPI
jgi:hypothetical protein